MPLGVKPSGVCCWGAGESQPAVCMCECASVFSCKLEQSCGPGGSYVQVPATGGAEVQGQLLSGQRVRAQLLEGPTLDRCLSVYQGWTTREGSRMKPLVLSVFV